jgi:hypothetical protein
VEGLLVSVVSVLPFLRFEYKSWLRKTEDKQLRHYFPLIARNQSTTHDPTFATQPRYIVEVISTFEQHD